MAASTSSSTVADDSHQFSGTQNEALSFDLSGASHTEESLEMAQTMELSEQLPQLLETSEPERATKSGKCNLRKSLAWDSAFFTSAGVLNAEELSTMIKGVEKGVNHILPGIEEDLHTSMDSISTLESDNLTLESLEGELFEDIRASIQKSSRKTNMAISSSKTAPGGTDLQATSSSTSKKMVPAAGNKAIPKSGVKMYSNAMTGSGKMAKQGSGCPQVTQPVTRNRESSSTIPRSTKISKVNPVSNVTTKRASLSVNHIKVENNHANSNAVDHNKGDQVSKTTSLGGPHRGVPKSSVSSRPSSLGSLTANKTASKISSSSCGSSGSSSDNISKSPATSCRNNSKTVSSSGVIPKTSSRIVPRSKTTALASGLSAHMVSSKLSSNISPASSISEWSTESSSSTSTVNQRTTSRASSETSSSCRSSTGDLGLHTQFTDKVPNANRVQGAELHCQNMKKPAGQTGSLSRPDSMKPSGLRMPSPKIGFFDGSKSVRTPNGGLHSQARLSTGLLKVGAGLSSPIGSSNKAKIGKLPPTKVVKASTDLKPDIRGSASPRLSQELQGPSAIVSSDVKDAETCPVKSHEVQTEICEISWSQTEHNRESRNLGMPDYQPNINMQEITDLKELVTVLSEGSITASSLGTCTVQTKPYEVDEDVKKKSPGKTNEKETDNSGDQVDDLARDCVAMNLQLAMQKDIVEGTKSCCEPDCSTTAPEFFSKQKLNDVHMEDPTLDIKEIATPVPEEGTADLSLFTCVDDIKPHVVGEGAIHGQEDITKKSHANSREKVTDDFGDQVDELAKKFVDMDLQLLMQEEIAGRTKSCCELDCSTTHDAEFCSKQNLVDVQMEDPTLDLKEIAKSFPDGGTTGSSLFTCVGDIKPHGMGEDAIHGQEDIKNKSLGIIGEKVSDDFGDQVDDLARNFVDMDLQLVVQEEIAGRTKSCCELDCSNPCAPESCSKLNFVDVQKEDPKSEQKEILIPLPEGSITESSLYTCVGNVKPLGVGEDAICGQDDLKDMSLSQTNEKETDEIGDQVDELFRNFLAMDLQQAIEKEIAGSTELQYKRKCSDPCVPEFCSEKELINVQNVEATANSCEHSCSSPCALELWSGNVVVNVQENGPLANSCQLSCQTSCVPELFVDVQMEESTANSRIPLTDKNSFCNSEGSDVPTGLGTGAVVKLADKPSLEIFQKENI